MSDEPAFHHEISIVRPEDGWVRAGRMHIWTSQRALDAPDLGVVERVPEGYVRVPQRARSLHVVPAGRAFRVEHLFGFWLVSCGDTTILRVRSAQQTRHVLIWNASTPGRQVSELLWVCPRCGTVAASALEQASRTDPEELWRRALVRVRSFNASVADRTCPVCATVHPPSYGFHSAADTVEEAHARLTW